MNRLPEKINLPVLLGDWITLAIITAIGFLTHNQQFQIGRFLATVVPVAMSWVITAPWFGILSANKQFILRDWWKISYAVLLSIPLAVILRGWILGSSVQVTFTLVMVAMCMIGLWIWRFLWVIFFQKK